MENTSAGRRALIAQLKQELVGGLLLSPSEVAEILDIHARTVIDYIHGGRLRAWQLGGSWKIPERALRDFVTLYARQGGADPDKRSPFDASRWDDDDYRVRIEQTWYVPLAVDDLGFDAILDVSRRTYANRWKKRVDEDLVEIMKLLGSPPSQAVTLRLRPLGGEQELTIAGVEMTHQKRQRIWRANQTKRSGGPPP